MKEATGELNMTVITVVAIAAIAALFTIFILPSIQANIALTSACSNLDAYGTYQNTGTSDKMQAGCSDFTCSVTLDGGKQHTKHCNGYDDAT